MAAHLCRFFCLLTAISISTMLFFLTWGHLLRKGTANNRHKGEKTFFLRGDLWLKKTENSPFQPAFLTVKEAKLVNLTGIRPVRNMTAETPMPVLSRKAYEKLPQWEFEDVYNQDAPHRATTCAESLRNTKDENFTKAFLPNIRLFLHKDNINMSEWNRLSHFNSPFGFMDLKYDEVMTAAKMIPKPREPLLHPKPGGDGCVRCAVVGNAGILNGSRMGAEINSHDYVFRMNGAIIKGYEEDVGNKTSVYVHTAHSITKSLSVLKKYGYKSAPHDEGIKYVMIPEKLKDFQWLEGLLTGGKVAAGPYHNRLPRHHYGGQYNESRFYVMHQDFLRYVRNRFLTSSKLKTRRWSSIRPTNGAFTIFLALHTCDTVSAYGFMTEDFKKYSNYYVQRDKKTEFYFHPNHDFLLEKDTWINFHNRRILKLYQRNELEREKEKPK